eukprot:tig00020965_g16828.t1
MFAQPLLPSATARATRTAVQPAAAATRCHASCRASPSGGGALGRPRAASSDFSASRSAFLGRRTRSFQAAPARPIGPVRGVPPHVAASPSAELAKEFTSGKAYICTTLGPCPEARAQAAMALARKFASEGKRAIVAVQQNPLPKFYEGLALSLDPVEVAPNVSVVHLRSTQILEKGWELTKELEQKYLAVPFQRPGMNSEVFGVELPVLPGMDPALGLAALWQARPRIIDRSNKYDAIIYDGTGDLTTLRIFGAAEVSGWYVRRFRRIVEDSDIFRTLLPFFQAATAAVVSPSAGVSSSSPLDYGEDLLKRVTAAYTSPGKMAGFLVPGGAAVAGPAADLRPLWGAAMQAGLVIGGVLAPGASAPDAAALGCHKFCRTSRGRLPSAPPHWGRPRRAQAWAPLPVASLGALPASASSEGAGWEAALAALPDPVAAARGAPQPVAIDTAAKKVTLFLPGFSKGQVRLSQSGPELTIEAGDQRRNLFLPPALKSLQVKGAKFEEAESSLVISF